MTIRHTLPCGLTAAAVLALLAPPATAGLPSELLPGEAPVLFTGAEGEDADATLLLDGSPIRGDEIWLWVPATDVTGMVNLAMTGQFFRVWDSGPEAGPDGNDDDDNGMRGMDFDATTGTFLISYEDSTTTGFAFGAILDGDLMRMTPTALTNGFVTAFTLTRLFNECQSGLPGCIGTGDINAISGAADGTLFYGSGGTQMILTSLGGAIDATASTIVHADFVPDPVNIGPDPFFEGTVVGCGVIFCPLHFIGQLRGTDILDSGLVTFGTSGQYANTTFNGPIDGLTDEEAELLAVGLTLACEKADICSLPNHGDLSMNTYQRRTGEVLYAGSLFFQAPNVGDAEMLDHDILDSPAEIDALIDVLGANSDAGIALSAHVISKPCPQDLSGDGSIGFSDLTNLLNNWGDCPKPCPPVCAGDLNEDCAVGFADLTAVLNAWGPCP